MEPGTARRPAGFRGRGPAAGRAIALTEHRLGWEYAVLDVAALRAHLADQFTGVTWYAGRAVGSPERGVVALADGSSLRAAVVVDAAGRWRPLDPASSRQVPAEQTAYGVILDQDSVAPLVAAGEALFMDWRADHGEAGWPTFLYVVPWAKARCSWKRPHWRDGPGCRWRPCAGGSTHGWPTTASHLRKMHAPKRFRSRSTIRGTTDMASLGFGAAAPLIHPATGFSVAASLQLAPRVAAALAAHLPDHPDRALAAAQETVWPPAAKVIHRVRRIGLEALLRMPAGEVPRFFEKFFALPDAHRWAYLTARDDVGGTIAAMARLFRESDWRMRRHLVTPALMRPLPANDEASA